MICDERQFEETKLTKLVVDALKNYLEIVIEDNKIEGQELYKLIQRIKKEKLDVVLVSRDY